MGGRDAAHPQSGRTKSGSLKTTQQYIQCFTHGSEWIHRYNNTYTERSIFPKNEIAILNKITPRQSYFDKDSSLSLSKNIVYMMRDQAAKGLQLAASV